MNKIKLIGYLASCVATIIICVSTVSYKLGIYRAESKNKIAQIDTTIVSMDAKLKSQSKDIKELLSKVCRIEGYLSVGSTNEKINDNTIVSSTD